MDDDKNDTKEYIIYAMLLFSCIMIFFTFLYFQELKYESFCESEGGIYKPAKNKCLFETDDGILKSMGMTKVDGKFYLVENGNG